MDKKERKEMFQERLRTHTNVCRVQYYNDECMYVKCPNPKKCVNPYRKYHMYKITDSDCHYIGGEDGRSSHCGAIGNYSDIMLVFKEGSHEAKKVPFDVNLTTGHVYKRPRRTVRV
jgi:hypothetical protein